MVPKTHFFIGCIWEERGEVTCYKQWLGFSPPQLLRADQSPPDALLLSEVAVSALHAGDSRGRSSTETAGAALPQNGGFLTSSFAGTWSVRNQDGAGDCPALSEGLGYGSSRGSFPPAVVSAMCRFASLLALGLAIWTGFCSSVACSRDRFLLFSCLHFSFMLQPWFKVTFSTRRCFLTHQLH